MGIPKRPYSSLDVAESSPPPTLINAEAAECDVSKLVICSRCHRNIPENGLAAHMLTHKGKVRMMPRAPRQSPKPSTATTIPTSFAEFSKKIMESRPQKSNLSSEQVRGVFEQILNEMELPISSLKIGLKTRVQAEVEFDENRNVELFYDDNYFRTLDEGEIKATLSHEACHIATLPDSRVVVVANTSSYQSNDPFQSMQVSFIEFYDEFLAHKEFARRFRGSETFALYDQIKDRDFQNYNSILKAARLGLMDATNAIITILNDAVYFPVIGDSRFQKWCEDSGLLSASAFLDWLLEDFRFIAGLNLDRMRTMSTVVQEGVLTLGVDVQMMLAEDAIAFLESAPEAEARMEAKNGDLAARWRERRLAISSGKK